MSPFGKGRAWTSSSFSLVNDPGSLSSSPCRTVPDADIFLGQCRFYRRFIPPSTPYSWGWKRGGRKNKGWSRRVIGLGSLSVSRSFGPFTPGVSSRRTRDSSTSYHVLFSFSSYWLCRTYVLTNKLIRDRNLPLVQFPRTGRTQ